VAFLGWLGKSVPAIGNLGYTLGLSDKPVEVVGGYTPNPIPAIAGALSGNPLLATAGSSISSSTSNMGAPLGAYLGNSGATSMNNTELAAKWLNAGLAYQPAVASPSPGIAIETAQSGVVPASMWSALPAIGGALLKSPGGQGALGGALGGAVATLPDWTGGSSGPDMAGATPIGKLRLSSKGNLIITRSMKRKMKSLADTVGLEQAAALVGIDIRTESAILLKSFPTREKGVTGRDLRQCRRVVNKMKHFYSMIPTRTTSSRRSTTVARGVTQIKN